jgi:branched-chain amino acid transport system ATP-binding protein
MAVANPLLEVRELVVTLGAVRAVDGVSFAIGHGELFGLIGPNGAGKTTTIDAVTGFVPSRGSVHLGGLPLHGLAPHRRARIGLTRTWQSLELFDDLTVRDNCAVGAGDGAWTDRVWQALRPGRTAGHEAAEKALESLDLGEVADRSPAELSLGQRKLVAVARALASGPRLLLLDEPAAGLDSAESLQLGAKLRQLAERGVSILLVDHDMGLVLGVCDRVAVLEYGRVVACGTPRQVQCDPRVVEAYLGANHDEVAADEPQPVAVLGGSESQR